METDGHSKRDAREGTTPSSDVVAGAALQRRTVDVREEAGQLVIEPVRPSKYELERLLAGITQDNVHSEVGFGTAVGKEAF